MTALCCASVSARQSTSNNDIENANIQPDPCTATVAQLGPACQAFWIDLVTNVNTALYSQPLATWLCQHPCLQPCIDVAVTFIQQGKHTGDMVM